MEKFCTYCVISALFVACAHRDRDASQLKSEYQPVRGALEGGDIVGARAVYPDKELDGFINVFEKSWLDFLQGLPPSEDAVQLSRERHNSHTVFLSDEIHRLFASPHRSYQPAENEAIFFHIMLGFAFLRADRLVEARVEAKRASLYLQGHYGDEAGEFDDPGLRLMLGALWYGLDEWQHARVDFKVAAQLHEGLSAVRELAEMDRPPPMLTIHLAGFGPEVVSDPSQTEEQKWQLSFVGKDQPEQESSWDADGLKVAGPVDTGSWYPRHLSKDNRLRSAFDHTKHGIIVVFGAAGSIVVMTGALIVSVAMLAGSVALVAGYYAALGRAGSGFPSEALSYPFDFLSWAIPASMSISGAGAAEAQSIYQGATDESEYYRFVRFLPDRIYAAYGEGDLEPRADSQKPARVLIDRTSGGGKRLKITHSGTSART